MVRSEASSPAPRTSAEALPEFVCAEICGGNRPIDAPIELPGIQGWVFSRPCEGGRGGDIHYLSICSSGLISRMCLADVAGHGRSVALVSGEIHRLLLRYMNRLDERRVLSDLNERLMAAPDATMTTAVTASYFPPLRQLSLTYAGHPPAWLYRKHEDHWRPVPPVRTGDHDRRLRDLPLAIDEHTSFSRRKIHVALGDRLLLVTDGVLEAPSPDRVLYGEARLAELLAHHRHDGTSALATSIVDAVAAHTHDPGLSHDDVTLLLAEFIPGPPALGAWELVKNRFLGRRRRIRIA